MASAVHPAVLREALEQLLASRMASEDEAQLGWVDDCPDSPGEPPLDLDDLMNAPWGEQHYGDCQVSGAMREDGTCEACSTCGSTQSTSSYGSWADLEKSAELMDASQTKIDSLDLTHLIDLEDQGDVEDDEDQYLAVLC
jgi:Fe-S cluster biogenesis protein NfuA